MSNSDIEFVDSEAAHELVRSGRTELASHAAPLPEPKLRSDVFWHDPLALSPQPIIRLRRKSTCSGSPVDVFRPSSRCSGT